MKEEVIKKYVKDLDGLLGEIKRWKKPEIIPPHHDTIVLMFGLLLRYLRFDNIPEFMASRKIPLDAQATFGGNPIYIEFEKWSGNFSVDHASYKDVCNLIVCWDDNWKECPDNIDVFELKYFWEKANPT